MESTTHTSNTARGIPEKNVEQLYEHLRSHSDLSAEAIRHEIDTILSDINFGASLFQVLDLEEISFLIEKNRYQEKAHGKSDGTYVDIDVEGRVGDKNLFLVSETGPLMKKTARDPGSNPDRIVIIAGDMTQHASEGEYGEAANLLRSLLDEGIRVVLTPGNHDFGDWIGEYFYTNRKARNRYSARRK